MTRWDTERGLHACNDGCEPTVDVHVVVVVVVVYIREAYCVPSIARRRVCMQIFLCQQAETHLSPFHKRRRVERRRWREVRHPVRARAHTLSLPRGSPVGGLFLPCNFNNHILQPLNKMASQDRRRDPPRFFF